MSARAIWPSPATTAQALAFPLVCAVATLRVLLAHAPAAAPRADEATKRLAFLEMRTHERDMRRDAAQDFPTDPWSQDDAFHAYEMERARNFAGKHHIALTDVVDALDTGMRAQRARGDKSMIATVPPCHPRAIY